MTGRLKPDLVMMDIVLQGDMDGIETAAVLKEELDIPVLPAGGIFTGTDAVEYLQLGAAAVQLATRFTVTEECGLPAKAKQVFFANLAKACTKAVWNNGMLEYWNVGFKVGIDLFLILN